MDNFDLKKFLKESKAIENLNPSFRSLNENAKDYYKDAEADDAAHIRDLEDDMKDDKKASLKEKIKEMIVAELSADAVAAKDYDFLAEDELEEAKKKKDFEDVEDVEDVEVTDTTEEVDAEDITYR
jgi:hypothetical protein